MRNMILIILVLAVPVICFAQAGNLTQDTRVNITETVPGHNFLINGKHTEKDCINSGGTLWSESSSAPKFCRFKASDCHLVGGEWSSYKDWKAYGPQHHTENLAVDCDAGCTAGSTAFQSAAKPTSCKYCKHKDAGKDTRCGVPVRCGYTHTNTNVTLVGCY